MTKLFKMFSSISSNSGFLYWIFHVIQYNLSESQQNGFCGP